MLNMSIRGKIVFLYTMGGTSPFNLGYGRVFRINDLAIIEEKIIPFNLGAIK